MLQNIFNFNPGSAALKIIFYSDEISHKILHLNYLFSILNRNFQFYTKRDLKQLLISYGADSVEEIAFYCNQNYSQ